MLRKPIPPLSSSSSPSSSSTQRLPRPANLDSYVRELGEWDVLLGRGTGPNEHHGNTYYREVVEQQTEAYFSSTTNRKEKAAIIQSTINEVTAKKGGRFVKKLKKHEIRRLRLSSSGGAGEAVYRLVDTTSLFEKTKQAFRYACKKEINDDGKEDEKEEPDEKYQKKVTPVSLVHGSNRNIKRTREEPPTECLGETSLCPHPPPLQKKARHHEEAGAVSTSCNSSSTAVTTLGAAALGESSSSSSSSSWRHIAHPPVSQHFIESLFLNCRRPGTFDLATPRYNSRETGPKESSGSLQSKLFGPAAASAATSSTARGGSNFAGAVLTRPSPPSCLLPPCWQYQQQKQQISQEERMHSLYSTTRTRSLPAYTDSLEALLAHPRKGVDPATIAQYGSSAEVLLHHALLPPGGGGGIVPPPQLSQFTGFAAPPQQAATAATTAATAATAAIRTGSSLINNNSNLPARLNAVVAELAAANKRYEYLTHCYHKNQHHHEGGGPPF